MGNSSSVPTGIVTPGNTKLPPQPISSVLGELGPEVVYDQSLGTSRFLKTVRALHQDGPLVVKVFYKADPSVSLKPHIRRIKVEREALLGCPNVLPYARVLETERAGYLIRQYGASNLYDRISTRPFLSGVEKKWVAFQLLMGLAAARERGIAHGDIKTENVLITSSLTAYLTDFSSFKPVHLPLDDPSPFSYYFDTSSRRTCYVAPERFYAPNSDIARKKEKLETGKRDGRITEEADVFSLGCVLAEMWGEGTAVFTLSQMYKFREGEFSPEGYLMGIEDVEIREMIRSMILLAPATRLTFKAYLSQYRGTAFPTIFYDYLHPFLSTISAIPPSPSATPPHTATHTGTSTPLGNVSTAVTTALGVNTSGRATVLKTAADEIVETVAGDWENIVRWLEEDANSRSGEKTEGEKNGVDGQEEEEDRRPEAAETSEMGRKKRILGKEEVKTIFPVKLHIPGVEDELAPAGCSEDGPALLVLSLILSNIRNCQHPATILRALDLLLALGKWLTDETRLDRLVPYLVVLVEDEVASVRSAAIRTLTQTLLLIKTITPSNASLFTEYILPNTRNLSTDSELLVRTTYASCIASLAETSKRFLEMKEAMKTEGTFRREGKGLGAGEWGDGIEENENYDSSLAELQLQIQDHLAPLLTDSSSVVKRALLSSIGPLCNFFGRAKANDAILAHLVTYLNTRDWSLRAAWNEHAVEVGLCVGPHSLEEYILPLVMLSLSDSEEFVTATVLTSLTTLAEKRMLGKGKIWDLVMQVTGFLCHPNIWIREGAAAFLTAVAKILPPTDRWCIFYPTIKRLLRADVKDITELALLDNAREPLSRLLFEAAVTWAGKAGKSQFWSLPRTAATKGAPRDPVIRTDEDRAQLEKMKQLGMKPEDEYKLSMLREYISKLAVARQATNSKAADANDSLSHGGVVLQELGIIGETIIFGIRDPKEMADSARDAHLRLPDYPRRFSADTPRSPSSIAGSRHPSGQPIDDLRRRLALVGGSNTSLPSPGSDISRLPTLERTVSHTSTDEASDAGGSVKNDHALPAAKVRSRVHLNGVDVGRVAPAIGQDTTNAMGFFNVDVRYRPDEDAMSGTNAVSAMAPQASKAWSQLPATGTQRFFSTYEGDDPRIKQLVERGFLDNFREPVPELGPHIPLGIPRSRALRTNFLPRERRPLHPEGKLIAHLVEHTAAITDIKVAPDQLFFVTGSEDGTVKVWDTIRLEKNVTSRSRHTYVQGGKITSICVLEHSHCVASASDNGTIWIHRVDISMTGTMPRYGKQQLIRQQSMDDPGDFVTCMSSYNTQTTSNLVLGTARSNIIILDIRTMRKLHEHTNPNHFGPITCLCIDPNRVWLVAGTASGTMTLWDLRFGLLLRSWCVGKRRVHKAAVHPSKGKNRWVILAIEDDGVEDDVSKRHGALIAEVWDVDRGLKVEEYRAIGAGGQSTSSRSAGLYSSGEPSFIMQEATLDPSAAIKALVEAISTPVKLRPRLSAPDGISSPLIDPSRAGASRPGVRTFLAGVDYSLQHDQRFAPTLTSASESKEAESKKDVGYLLTAGEDRKIRFWDLDKIDRSTVVSGLELEADKPVYTAHTSTTSPSLFLESPAVPPSRSSRTVQTSSSQHPSTSATPLKVHRSTVIANAQHQMLSGHQDTIMALLVIDLPFRCVVSGDRSGVVKVFE